MTEVEYLQKLDLTERQEKIAARFEALLGRVEGLLQTAIRLALVVNDDSDRSLELVDNLRKVAHEASTQLLAKAMSEALEDYEHHKGPLDHRRVPERILRGPS